MLNVYLPEGDLMDSKENKDALSEKTSLEAAMREGTILEAPAVRCSNDFDLTVDLGFASGVMKRNEVALTDGEEVKDIAVITRVGKPVCFKVIGKGEDDDGNLFYRLSRRAAQEECRQNYLDTLLPGDVIRAKVTHLEAFGAFCDIGCGVPALLPIDAISVSRISHPKDRLSVGQEMDVVVKSIERSAFGSVTRVYVTRKELLGTWEENASLFEAGQTVVGIVRSMESYGIFVELAPNLAGLAEFRSDISVGQAVAVYIKSILPERMKIKLVIVDPYRGIPKKNGAGQIAPSMIGVTHLSRWVYSPAECQKLVMTEFDF